MLKFKSALIIVSASAIFGACSPGRSMLNSGKVVPKKQVRVGINNTINITSVPIEQTIKSATSIYNTLNNDSVDFEREGMADIVTDVNAAVMAYCIDPITVTDDIYLRVGLGHRMDVGYKNSGGAHVFDVQYQFLGSNENFNTSTYKGYYGSVAVQYAHKSFNFSNNPILEKLEKSFVMEMSRSEITVPVIFSKSWGAEEKIGCFSWGLMYTHAFVNYKIRTENIYTIANEIDPNNSLPKQLLQPVDEKVNFGSYGTFFNLKIGYKVVFFNLGMSVYYQNYGGFKLLGGRKVHLEGWSFIPTYGLQFNLFTRAKKKPATT